MPSPDVSNKLMYGNMFLMLSFSSIRRIEISTPVNAEIIVNGNRCKEAFAFLYKNWMEGIFMWCIIIYQKKMNSCKVNKVLVATESRKREDFFET